MIDFNKRFESDLVLVRPMAMTDIDEMSMLTTESDMWIYYTADLSKKEELRKWMAAGVNSTARFGMTVVDKEINGIIGSTSIATISERDRRAEIGWTWICKSHQGRGYNAEVKRLLLSYLLEECNLQRVELKTDVLNIPARKAMKKIGLVEEGILRSHTQMIRNRRRDTIYYSVLRDEWASMKSSNSWS